MASIPAMDWLKYGSYTGWNCFYDENFVKEVAENPSIYVTATLANGVEVEEESQVKLTSLAINGKSVKANWVTGDNDGVRTFNDNFARWGIHILTNDDENVSDTDATSIKSGDVITQVDGSKITYDDLLEGAQVNPTILNLVRFNRIFPLVPSLDSFAL